MCYKLQLLRGSKLLQQLFWQFFFNLSDVTAGNGFAAEKFFTLTFFAQRKSCLWKSGGKGFQNKSEARDSKSVFARRLTPAYCLHPRQNPSRTPVYGIQGQAGGQASPKWFDKDIRLSSVEALTILSNVEGQILITKARNSKRRPKTRLRRWLR
jgi:hypothetical protein